MRNIFLVISFLILGFGSIAQNASNNPFSYYGLGEISGRDHAVFSGLGNTEITYVDSAILNYYNPASYSAIGKGQPIFSTGFSARLSTYKQVDLQEFSSISGVQHFAFGLSFAKSFGLAAGLRPYSNRQYEVSSAETVDGDSIFYQYSGSGGINETFIGLSADILPFLDSTSLSFGGNIGWLFGNVENTRKSWTSQVTSNGGVGIKAIDVRSVHYNFGASFNHAFNKQHKIGLYATIDPSQQLNASFNNGVYYATNIYNPASYDTASYYELSDEKIVTAPEFTYGLSYSYSFIDDTNKVRTLHPTIALHASYSTTAWSQYSNPYEPSQTYLDASKFTVGVQFIPESDLEFNTSKTNILEKIRYRAGYYSYTLPYMQNNVQVKDFGTTFGLGIPVTFGNSLSSVNLGMAIGRRGTTDLNQINETYYGINFGISISPGAAERWFQKRKVN